jgi:hypothetical protein
MMPEIRMSRLHTGFWHFPYPPDGSEDRTNNGGIDLVREPERIDEITELKTLPNFRSMLLDLNGPKSQFFSLGLEAGEQNDEFFGYLELAFRNPSLATEDSYRRLLQSFVTWVSRKQPQLTPYMGTCLVAEIQEFFYEDRMHGDRITLWFHATNQEAGDEFLCLIAEFLLQWPDLKLD